MTGVNPPRIFIVAVSGGSGTLTTAGTTGINRTMGGLGKALGVIPQAASAYDIEITDSDGFIIIATTSQVTNGDKLNISKDFPLYPGPHTIKVTSSTDGDYQVKVWFE